MIWIGFAIGGYFGCAFGFLVFTIITGCKPDRSWWWRLPLLFLFWPGFLAAAFEK